MFGAVQQKLRYIICRQRKHVAGQQVVILMVIKVDLSATDFLPFRWYQDCESTNAKFFENVDSLGVNKVRDIVIEEKRQAITVLIVLKRIDDASNDRNNLYLNPLLSPMILLLINP